MSVIFYSTGCPRCDSLKKKLDNAGVQYELVTDVNEIMKQGFKTAPVLKVGDKVYKFSEAIVKFKDIVNSVKEN